jgi:hypothetical protein
MCRLWTRLLAQGCPPRRQQRHYFYAAAYWEVEVIVGAGTCIRVRGEAGGVFGTIGYAICGEQLLAGCCDA